MTAALPPIHSLTLPDLAATLAGLGLPRFRARQIWHWLYVRQVTDFNHMTDLSLALRETLSQRFSAAPLALRQTLASADGTRKFLLRTVDNQHVETVWIPAGPRRTVCVSSQIGCPLGCAFCASAQGGFARNLSAGEITAQVMRAARAQAERPTHLVFMGMGEPLLNLDAVLDAARILNDPAGVAIGARRITLSTSGVVPGIRRLAQTGLQFELSVSLHAPDDPLRDRLMPINRRWPLEVLLKTCREYFDATGRLVTFEYTLIEGVNDTPDQARALARRLRTFPGRINLIPLSPIAEFAGRAPPEGRMEAFRRTIEAAGINVTIRRSRGGAVDAACGQLRRRSHREPE